MKTLVYGITILFVSILFWRFAASVLILMFARPVPNGRQEFPRPGVHQTSPSSFQTPSSGGAHRAFPPPQRNPHWAHPQHHQR